MAKRQCPLCGSKKISKPYPINQYGAMRVKCNGCGRQMQPDAATVGTNTHKGLKTTWRHRPHR